MVFRRTPKEVKEAKKAAKKSRKAEIEHVAGELEALYTRVTHARDEARSKLDEYIEKIEAGAPQTEIDTAKNEYDTANAAVKTLQGELAAKERIAKRKHPNAFRFL